MSDVRFIALYEDGSEEPFDVPQHTLRNGASSQENGKLSSVRVA
jgi:hypothetical protein